jgi:hypothetical protein
MIAFRPQRLKSGKMMSGSTVTSDGNTLLNKLRFYIQFGVRFINERERRPWPNDAIYGRALP